MKVQHASSGFERSKDKSLDHGHEDNNKDRQGDGSRDRRDW